MSSPTPRAFSKSPLGWTIAISLSALLLYFAFKGANWRDLIYRLESADKTLIGCTMALITLALYLRARRWHILLNVDGTTSVTDTFWATALGYLGNYLLPARAGEVLRSVAIARRNGLSQGYVFATAVSERLFDAAVLVLFASIGLSFIPSLPPYLWSAVRVMGLSAAVGFVFLLVLPRCGWLITTIIQKTKLSEDLKVKLVSASAQFLLGSGALVNGPRSFRFITYTLLIWAVDSFSALMTARSINLHFSFAVALILIVAIALASAIPSTPGSLGVSQFVATSILGMFAIGKDSALAMILLWQGVIYVVIIFWGSVGAWQLRRKTADLRPAIYYVAPLEDLT